MLAEPVGSAEPAGAVLLDSSDHRARLLAVAETDENLVQDDVVQDRGAARFEQLGEQASVGAAAFDEVGDAASPERADRGVDREAAGPPRELGRPVDRIAHALVLRLDEIRRGHGHCGAVCVLVRAERDPRVVRDVQPFMGVGRPGIGPVGTAQQVRRARARPRPRGRTRRRGGTRLRPRSAASAIASKSSNAPVFTSPAWPQTIVGTPPRSGSSSTRIRPWSSAGTTWSELAPIPRSRSARSIVTWRFAPDDDADRGRAGETVGGDVPAGLREHVVPRGRERGDVRHLAAGDVGDRDIRAAARAARRASHARRPRRPRRRARRRRGPGSDPRPRSASRRRARRAPPRRSRSRSSGPRPSRRAPARPPRRASRQPRRRRSRPPGAAHRAPRSAPRHSPRRGSGRSPSVSMKSAAWSAVRCRSSRSFIAATVPAKLVAACRAGSRSPESASSSSRWSTSTPPSASTPACSAFPWFCAGRTARRSG